MCVNIRRRSSRRDITSIRVEKNVKVPLHVPVSHTCKLSEISVEVLSFIYGTCDGSRRKQSCQHFRVKASAFFFSDTV